MENKLYLKARTSNNWIYYEDWKRVKAWNHYKNLMIWNLSPLKVHTQEEINNFNKWYKKNYRKNYKLLNLDENGKGS